MRIPLFSNSYPFFQDQTSHDISESISISVEIYQMTQPASKIVAGSGTILYVVPLLPSVVFDLPFDSFDFSRRSYLLGSPTASWVNLISHILVLEQYSPSTRTIFPQPRRKYPTPTSNSNVHIRLLILREDLCGPFLCNESGCVGIVVTVTQAYPTIILSPGAIEYSRVECWP